MRNAESEYVEYGCATNKQLFNIIKEYSNIFKKRIDNLNIYCYDNFIENNPSINISQVKKVFGISKTHKKPSLYTNSSYYDLSLQDKKKIPLIHISPVPLNLGMLKQKKGSYFDENIDFSALGNIDSNIDSDINRNEKDNIIDDKIIPMDLSDIYTDDSKYFFNPNGLWFSIGSLWANSFSYLHYDTNDEIIDTIKNIENSLNKYSKYGAPHVLGVGGWYPAYVYEIDISNLNIYTINSCTDYHKLYETYKNNNANSIANMINWGKLRNDYDGIMIYTQFKYMDCCEYCQKHDINSYGEITAVDAVLFGRINKKDFSTIWQENWDKPSGVIWRNYSNIRLKLLYLD